MADEMDGLERGDVLAFLSPKMGTNLRTSPSSLPTSTNNSNTWASPAGPSPSCVDYGMPLVDLLLLGSLKWAPASDIERLGCLMNSSERNAHRQH